jgi:hypothetical protein
MDNVVQDRPNLTPETVTVQKVDSGLDSIASKMAAMKQQTLRNQMNATNTVEAGSDVSADTSAPVAPEGVKVEDNDVPDSDINLVEPEIEATDADDGSSIEDGQAPDQGQVSDADSTTEDLIDFLDFADTHPNAKFKFMRNGKEITIDAKKAAAILGQGAAISEDARQLKIRQAEFDEYLQSKRAEQEGLVLAMEFTVKPQLQKAYDEIIKTQQYQNTFAQQLAATNDPAQRARIQANMAQNERYIQQQGDMVKQLKPNVDQFYDMRRQQVSEILETSRKNFKDKELRNSVVYNEIRDKVSEGWEGAKRQLVPGIDNIDLISSDEHLMSLVRDGLKYRDRPKTRSAGASIAALTNRKSSSNLPSPKPGEQVSDLRTKARGGDMKAADNLLLQQMAAIRSQRRGR